MYLHNGLNDCISSPFICTNFSRLYQFNVQCCPGISYVCVLVFDKRSLLTTAKEPRWHSPQADYDSHWNWILYVRKKTKCVNVTDGCKLLVVGDVDYEFVRLAVGELELILIRYYIMSYELKFNTYIIMPNEWKVRRHTYWSKYKETWDKHKRRNILCILGRKTPISPVTVLNNTCELIMCKLY